jgi:hypothetical protein
MRLEQYMLLTTAHGNAFSKESRSAPTAKTEPAFSICGPCDHRVMMSVAPEVAALTSNRVDVLEQQLAHANEMLAVRDQELLFVKRSLANALLLPGAVASQALMPAQDRAVRQRAVDVTVSPLEDELLDKIFGLVGNGEYFFVASVCRRWRGRYITLRYRATAKDLEEEEAAEEAAGEEVDDEDTIERDKRKSLLQSKLRTGLASAVTTAGRFQMALNDKLTVAQLRPGLFGHSVAQLSLDPIAVFALAKQYDLRWHVQHCLWAVLNNRLELLQWLRRRGCPWSVDHIFTKLSSHRRVDVDLLKWLQTRTGPWGAPRKANLLRAAVRTENFPAAEWLREQGAAWPKSFQTSRYWVTWTQQMVQYALQHGALWGDWKCQKYSPAALERMCSLNQQRVKELLDWAHANGCPCTCGQAQS